MITKNEEPRGQKNNRQPTVSIAMATYNGGDYIKEQLESISEQTRLPEELVVFDDSSDDNTADIVDQFARTSSFPVRLKINSTKSGAKENFTKALLACAGDVVFICDQDDVWLPQKIARTLKVFEDSPKTVGVATNSYICDQNLNRSGATVFATANPANGGGNAYRRDFLHFALPVPPTPISYDGWLYRISALMNARQDVSEVLRLWRRHDAALSGWKSPDLNAKPFQRSKWYLLARKSRELQAVDRRRFLRKDLINLQTAAARTKEWIASNPPEAPLTQIILSLNERLPTLIEVTESRLAALEQPRFKRLRTTIRLRCDKKLRRAYTVRNALTDILTRQE